MPTSVALCPPLAKWKLALLSLSAAVSYWIVFSTTHGAAMILVALPCLFLLHRVRTARQAFYLGLFTGIAMYAPPLAFFHKVFGPAALALYLIAGLPIGFFVMLTHLAHRRISPGWMILLTPILWTGIEYFRGELYWLRFAWLLPGQAVAFVAGVRMLRIGVYGVGFVLALVSALIVSRRCLPRSAGTLAALSLAILMYGRRSRRVRRPDPCMSRVCRLLRCQLRPRDGRLCSPGRAGPDHSHRRRPGLGLI
jgi:hypothetical protein